MKKKLYKSISLVLSLIIISISFFPTANVFGKEIVIDDSTINNIVHALNMVGDNEEYVIDSQWAVRCVSVEEIAPCSVYSDSKTQTKIYYVEQLTSKKAAFSITQTVKYTINDINQSVTLNEYYTSSHVYLDNFTCTKKYSEKIANGDGLPGVGSVTYAAYSVKYNVNRWISCYVSVNRSGVVTYDYRVI